MSRIESLDVRRGGVALRLFFRQGADEGQYRALAVTGFYISISDRMKNPRKAAKCSTMLSTAPRKGMERESDADRMVRTI